MAKATDRLKISNRFFLFLVILISIGFEGYSQVPSSNRNENVILQLRWLHQFQFAGYYAAIEKGFYKEAGLNVQIREGGLQRDTIIEVMSKQAQYGVSNSEILLHRLKKKPLVVLAAIFQHSPLVIVSRKETELASPQSLAGKRVKMTMESRDIELHAMFLNEGVPLNRIQMMETPSFREHYFDQSIDALSAYVTNEPYYYEQQGTPYSVIQPRTYGIDFFGDCLFTSEAELREHPDRVKSFREASLRGWAYAMSHTEEIIDLILDKYNSQKTKDHLRFEADKMRQLILPDLVDIGHMNPGRWQHIAETFRRFQMIDDDYSLDGFIYQPDTRPNLAELYWTIGFVAVVLGIISLVALVLFRLNRRLKLEIKDRNLAEEAVKKERDFMAAILRWIESIVVVIDLDGYVTGFNKAAEKCSGYTLEEVQQAKFWEIPVPPEERERVKEAVLNVKTKSIPNENENCWITKNGQERLIHWFNSVLTGKDGDIEYILCTGLDLTERSQIEKTLLRREEHYRRVLENMEEGYFEIDLAGNFTMVNKSIIETLGYSKSELIGMNYRAYMTKETANRVFQIYSSVHKTGKSLQLLSYDIIRKDGVTRSIEISISLLRDSTGSAIGFFGIARDATDRKRMEEMMVQSEKMLSVGGLAAGMAHEINNPLAGMMQTANVMSDRLTKLDTPANVQAAKELGTSIEAIRSFMENRGIIKMLDNIRISGTRVAEIVTNMLSFARKSDSTTSSHKITDLLEQTVDMAGSDYDLKSKFDFRKIEIVREYEKNLPEIPCESSKIQQVILNILRNGAEAMQEESDREESGGKNGKKKIPRINLRLKHEQTTNMIRLEIEDNGPGMNEITRKRAFEPFFTTKPVGVGTGLGLSVSYFIVTENHGGTMAVESNPGKGAKFVIRLPIAKTTKEAQV